MMGGADDEVGPDSVHVSRSVLLLDAIALETDLLAAGATCSSGSDDTAQATQTTTFYDGPNMELTLRGWWLSEHADGWRLEVPIYEPIPGFSDQFRFAKHDEVSDPVQILERMGLPEHADFVRLGKCGIDKMLYQAKISAFASLRSTRQSYVLKRFASDASAAADSNSLVRLLSEGDDRELSVAIEKMELDISNAENQTVSNILFTMGSSAPSVLRATSASFKCTCSFRRGATTLKEVAADLRRDLATFIRDRCLISAIPAREIAPTLYAYLGTLRPRHLTFLYKGLVLSPSQELENWQAGDCDAETVTFSSSETI